MNEREARKRQQAEMQGRLEKLIRKNVENRTITRQNNQDVQVRRLVELMKQARRCNDVTVCQSQRERDRYKYSPFLCRAVLKPRLRGSGEAGG